MRNAECDNPSEVTDVTPPPLTQGRLLVEGVQGSLCERKIRA